MKGQLQGKNLLFTAICSLIITLTAQSNSDSSIVNSSEWNKGDVNHPKDLDKLGSPIWYKRDSYKCPSLFGAFSDKEDCNYFYVCVGGFARRTRCPPFTQFDKYRKKCVSLIVAVCDTDKDDEETTIGEDTTTAKEKKFTCPGLSGSHPHPDDCSKYYKCTFFIPSLKTCPKNELFDGVKKECKPEDEVHCGTRIRPTSETTATTSPMLPESTTPKLTTPEPTSTKPTTIEQTTPEPTTIEQTTPEPTTTEQTTPEPTTIEQTTPEPTTTEQTTAEPTTLETTTMEPESSETTTGSPRPTGPPDNNCDEDDLDCIITETGEIPDWFECPVDVGSHRHPVSKKLFIFCINWKPYVKKCGQDLIYSQEVRTCVKPDFQQNLFA